MSGFLLDTNVVSELRKRDRCAPKVDAWIRSLGRNQDFISVLTVGELMRGIVLKGRKDPVAAGVLEKWIGQLEERYAERILPITLEVAEAWGRLGAMRTIPPEDGLIAATAKIHGLTLVTRNVKHIEGLGVAVLNPWK